MGMGCLSKRARTRCWRCRCRRRSAESAQAWWSVRCVAGRRMSELLRNLGVLHCHGFGGRVGEGAEVACWSGRWWRFRPMRFSGSGIGSEARRSGVVTSRRRVSRQWRIRSLGAATPLADSERFLLTGRLSADGAGMAQRPCGVRDGAGARDGAVGAGFCSGAQLWGRRRCRS